MRITVATLYIYSLSYVMSGISGLKDCENEGKGYRECLERKAICLDTGNSYICECPAGMQFGRNGIGECEDAAIDVCSIDSSGYRFCESEFALCRNVPNITKGYECYCAEGKIRIDGLCKDASEVEQPTDPITETTTLLSLPSSVLLTSGTETTIETLNNTSSDVTYIFNTSTESFIFSSFTPPPLITSFDYDTSTSFITTSDKKDTEECSRKHCSKNATCFKLFRGFTCRCKTGFVLDRKFSVNERSCLSNCTLTGCKVVCKKMKCFLEEKENFRNTSGHVYFENNFSGWSSESITVCGVLGFLLLIFVVSTAYLFQRYRKLKKNQYEEKQVVFKKTDKNDQCSESVRETLPNGLVVISYVFPNSKSAKGIPFPC